MTALVNELAALTRDLLVRRTAPRTGTALMTGGFDETTLKQLSGRFDVPRLVQMLNLLQKTAADVVRSSNRRTDVELCLVTLCDPTLDGSVAGLNARLSRLEQGAASQPPRPVEKEQVVPAKDLTPNDPPPWDVPAQPAQEPEPAPAPVRKEAGVPASRPTPAGGSLPGWPVLRDALKPETEMGDYIFLSNSAMVGGCLEGDTLTLWANNDFIKGMIDKQAILEKVASKASQLAGRPIRVAVKVGTAPEERLGGSPAPAGEEEDALEAFLAEGLENLTVE